MLKRFVLSVFAGALVATMLSLSSTAMAACFGYCADRTWNGGVFDSCTITYDKNGEITGPPTCFYTSSKVVPLEEAAY